MWEIPLALVVQLDKILRHGYVIFFLFYHFSESFNYMFLPVVGSHPLQCTVATFCKDSIFSTLSSITVDFMKNFCLASVPCCAIEWFKGFKRIGWLNFKHNIYISNRSKMYMVCRCKIKCEDFLSKWRLWK